MNTAKEILKQERGEINLLELTYLLLLHRWLIIFVLLVSISIGATLIFFSAPVFESKLLMQVDTIKNNPVQNLLSEFGTQGLTQDQTITQIALIRSRFILEPVIEKLGLDINISRESSFFDLFNHDTTQILIEHFNVPRRDIDKKFKIQSKQKDTISLYAPSGELILEGKVNKLLKDKSGLYSIRIKQFTAETNKIFFLRKISKLHVVEQLINQLKVNQLGDLQHGSTGIIELSLRGNHLQKIIDILNHIALIVESKDVKKKSLEAAKTLDFLYQQLPISQNQLQVAETKLNAYRAKSGKLDIKMQTQFFLQKMVVLDQDIEKLKLHRLSLSDSYTEKHPKIINLNKKISTLVKKRYLLEKNLKKLPASDQIAVNLLRDVGVKKMLYMVLLQKIQELEVIRAGTLSSINILTHASTPDYPLPNKTRIILLLSVLFGLIISVLIIGLKNILYYKIEDPHWVERHYGIPNLAIIPYAKEQTDNILRLNDKKYILLAHEQPRSLAIEALRSLRTSIQVNLLTSNNNVISIMGIAPSVGKSFISSNLAYLMSAAGKKVLLIDADLRKGTIHKYMHLEGVSGLAEVLEGKVSYEDAIIRNIFPQLDVLVRGNYPKNPSELLMKPILKSMIEDLSSQYDLIIVDTAPVLMVTDATVIGGLSANNYLIIGAKTHQSVEIDLVMKRLRASSVNLQGTLFNISKGDLYQNVLGRYARYGQYYYYNNYSNYYADEKV